MMTDRTSDDKSNLVEVIDENTGTVWYYSDDAEGNQTLVFTVYYDATVADWLCHNHEDGSTLYRSSMGSWTILESVKSPDESAAEAADTDLDRDSVSRVTIVRNNMQSVTIDVNDQFIDRLLDRIVSKIDKEPDTAKKSVLIAEAQQLTEYLQARKAGNAPKVSERLEAIVIKHFPSVSELWFEGSRSSFLQVQATDIERRANQIEKRMSISQDVTGENLKILVLANYEYYRKEKGNLNEKDKKAYEPERARLRDRMAEIKKSKIINESELRKFNHDVTSLWVKMEREISAKEVLMGEVEKERKNLKKMRKALPGKADKKLLESAIKKREALLSALKVIDPKSKKIEEKEKEFAELSKKTAFFFTEKWIAQRAVLHQIKGSTEGLKKAKSSVDKRYHADFLKQLKAIKAEIDAYGLEPGETEKLGKLTSVKEELRKMREEFEKALIEKAETIRLVRAQQHSISFVKNSDNKGDKKYFEQEVKRMEKELKELEAASPANVDWGRIRKEATVSLKKIEECLQRKQALIKQVEQEIKESPTADVAKDKKKATSPLHLVGIKKTSAQRLQKLLKEIREASPAEVDAIAKKNETLFPRLGKSSGQTKA